MKLREIFSEDLAFFTLDTKHKLSISPKLLMDGLHEHGDAHVVRK